MNDNPIIICGSTKAGTTLIRSLLDGHPELFVIPSESHFFRSIKYWVNYHTSATKPKSLSFVEMKEQLIELIKYKNSKEGTFGDSFTKGFWNLELFEKKLCETDTDNIKALLNLYVESMYYSLHSKDLDPNLRFVDKSIENAEYAADFENLYKGVKFIHIIRNPYSNLVSFRKFRNAKKRQNLKSVILSLYNSYYFLIRNMRLINNYLVIRYEDLVTRPENVMKDIANFLEISFEDSLLAPTILDDNWAGNSSTGQKFTGITDENLSAWKKEINPIEVKLVNEMFEYILDKFDYDKIQINGSLWLPKNENIYTFLVNRLLLYFKPKA